MAQINLLPWREEKRERLNREFITQAFAVALLSALVALGAWYLVNNELKNQLDANEAIRQENAKLDAKIAEIDTLEEQRDEIISRMKLIQDLQGRRPIPVRVWDDIVRAVPEQMFLTSLSRQNNELILEGRAENNNVISSLLRHLNDSQWLAQSAVESIQQEGVDAYQEDSTQPVGEDALIEANYVKFKIKTKIVDVIADENNAADQG